jgi:hypothetical protein
MKLARRGVELRLVFDAHTGKSSQVDAALLKAFARARCSFDEIASGQVRSLVAIARREGFRPRYVTRLPSWPSSRLVWSKPSPPGVHQRTSISRCSWTAVAAQQIGCMRDPAKICRKIHDAEGWV